MESDGGRLRRVIEKFFTAQTLRKRRAAMVRQTEKARAAMETTEILIRLDDVASITGLPRDHPSVLAITAFTLSREEAQDRIVIADDDVPYKSSFGSDW